MIVIHALLAPLPGVEACGANREPVTRGSSRTRWVRMNRRLLHFEIFIQQSSCHSNFLVDCRVRKKISATESDEQYKYSHEDVSPAPPPLSRKAGCVFPCTCTRVCTCARMWGARLGAGSTGGPPPPSPQLAAPSDRGGRTGTPRHGGPAPEHLCLSLGRNRDAAGMAAPSWSFCLVERGGRRGADTSWFAHNPR